jgi:hypothetical protein
MSRISASSRCFEIREGQNKGEADCKSGLGASISYLEAYLPEVEGRYKGEAYFKSPLGASSYLELASRLTH